MLYEVITPLIQALHVIHESPADHLVAAGGGVVARKVPVAQVAGTGGMQVTEVLEDDLQVCLAAGWPHQVGDLGADAFP